MLREGNVFSRLCSVGGVPTWILPMMHYTSLYIYYFKEIVHINYFVDSIPITYEFCVIRQSSLGAKITCHHLDCLTFTTTPVEIQKTFLNLFYWRVVILDEISVGTFYDILYDSIQGGSTRTLFCIREILDLPLDELTSTYFVISWKSGIHPRFSDYVEYNNYLLQPTNEVTGR